MILKNKTTLRIFFKEIMKANKTFKLLQMIKTKSNRNLIKSKLFFWNLTADKITNTLFVLSALD